MLTSGQICHQFIMLSIRVGGLAHVSDCQHSHYHCGYKKQVGVISYIVRASKQREYFSISKIQCSYSSLGNGVRPTNSFMLSVQLTDDSVWHETFPSEARQYLTIAVLIYAKRHNLKVWFGVIYIFVFGFSNSPFLVQGKNYIMIVIQACAVHILSLIHI